VYETIVVKKTDFKYEKKKSFEMTFKKITPHGHVIYDGGVFFNEYLKYMMITLFSPFTL
jgi:hypothetical protein